MKLALVPNLSRSDDNLLRVTAQLLESLRVKVSNTTLKETLLSHPDYPSLLSISDSLKRWQVDSMALKVTPDKLEELPAPFVAFVKGQRFLTIKGVKDSKVTWINFKNEEQTESKEDFLKRWEGIALLTQAGKKSGETNYKKITQKERWKALSLPIAGLIFLLLGLFRVITVAGSPLGAQTEYFMALITGHLLGMMVTGLLLWYEYDRHNPLLQKVCSMGKKSNCQAILGSKGAKVMGNITWSDIGFIYFTGGYLYLVLTGTTFLYPIKLLSLIALPYIVFSVYYQARVARQWCVFCLCVQAILLLEALSTLTMSQSPISIFPYFPPQSLIILLFSYLFPAFAWLFTKPFVYAAKKGNEYRHQLARFKNNGDIFEAMLQHQPAMNSDPGDMGIRIGNPEAPNVLTKVCNPYCGPCAKAHPKIEELIEENTDWQVQIIFTATGEDDDRRTAPAAHMLSVAAQKDETQTRKALDDWYGAEEKEYEEFAAKYPMNGELDLQKETLKAMDTWCKEVGITHTPTFFVNGYRLPDAYNDIAELKYITLT